MAESPPYSAVVLFDGECSLCGGWVQFVIRRDPCGVFRFAPRQSDAAGRLLAPFGIRPNDLGSIAAVAEGSLRTRSDAVLYILAQLGPSWRLLSALLRLIPRPLRDFGYSVLARNRQRFGRRGRCRLPTVVDAERFLR